MSSPRHGDAVGTALAVAIPLGVGFASLIVFRALGEPGGDRLPAGQSIAIAAGLVSVGTLIMVAVQAFGALQAANVRRLRPTSTVLQSVRIPALKRLFIELAAAERHSVPEPTHWFSVEAGTDGVAVWSGIFRPRRIIHFPWSVIASVEAGVVGPRVNGLVISLETASTPFDFRAPVLGKGPFGMFSMSSDAVRQIARDLSERL